MKTSLIEFAGQLRNTADIVDIIGSFVPLKRSGASYKGLCPFHKEKTPSFMVHPGKQLFHCFGCGVGGDVVKFWMMYERVDFRTAVEQIAHRIGLAIPELVSRPVDRGLEKKKAALLEVNKYALEFYQKRLWSSEGAAARQYLKKRGVSREMQKRFCLGYAPDRWEDFLLAAHKKGFSAELVKDAGLALPGKKKGGYYDRFRGRIIFPIFDAQGRCVAFGGRILGVGEPKYLNSPETEIYRKGSLLYGLNMARHNLRGEESALVVEGYMDLIALHSHGFETGIATLGTALTEQQARLLRRFTPQVIFLYDGDEAGQKAMLRGCEVLLSQSLAVKVVILPDNDDPDTFLKKHKSKAFNQILAEKKDFLDFFLETGRQKYDILTPEGKISVLELLRPILVRVREPILFDDYTRRIAEGLRLEQSLVIRHIRAKSNISKRRVGETIYERASQGIPVIELGFLKAIAENPGLRPTARNLLDPEWLTSPWVREVTKQILYEREVETDYGALLESASEQERQILCELAFFETCQESTPDLLSYLLNRLRIAHEARARHSLVVEAKKLEGHPASLEKVAPITDVIHRKTREIWETRKSLFEDK